MTRIERDTATWEKPTGGSAKRKRGRFGREPSGCFLFADKTQKPARRSTMRQSKDVFTALLKRGIKPVDDGKWWRGSQSGHAYLPLDTLVACARVSRGWRKALVDSGFDYGLATLGVALSKWRVGGVEGEEGPRADVDAPAELSKRLSMRLQMHTMASGQKFREVKQFLFRHGELSQKNATCRDDAGAKPFLPALLQVNPLNPQLNRNPQLIQRG